MVQGKSDPFMKWVRIGILALALIAVLALVIIKRNDIVPGWHTDGDAKYYVTFPLKRASGIETVSGSDYLFSEDGGHKLLYGWNKYDGYYYYSLPDGKIAKGETTVDGEQYYFDASTGKSSTSQRQPFSTASCGISTTAGSGHTASLSLTVRSSASARREI